MSLPSIFSVEPGTVSRAFVILLAVAILAMPMRAQDASSGPPAAPQPAKAHPFHLEDYSQPRSAFPHVLQPYSPRPVDEPNLGNSPRIDGLSFSGSAPGILPIAAASDPGCCEMTWTAASAARRRPLALGSCPP